MEKFLEKERAAANLKPADKEVAAAANVGNPTNMPKSNLSVNVAHLESDEDRDHNTLCPPGIVSCSMHAHQPDNECNGVEAKGSPVASHTRSKISSQVRN